MLIFVLIKMLPNFIAHMILEFVYKTEIQS